MREFSKYGKCYVKIRRDGRHMPFAFIQYIDESDARNALDQARGAVICGRSCRTEMVKANRTFIIMRKHGASITVVEARGVLSAFGDLSRAEMMHPTLRDSLGYPATVLVEFVRFDPDRDLYSVSTSPVCLIIASPSALFIYSFNSFTGFAPNPSFAAPHLPFILHLVSPLHGSCLYPPSRSSNHFTLVLVACATHPPACLLPSN